MRSLGSLKHHIVFCFQSFLKHKDSRPLRDVLAANPNRFITLLLPCGTQAAVRPGSPSTSTLRLDLQFQAVKVASASELAHVLAHPWPSQATHSAYPLFLHRS